MNHHTTPLFTSKDYEIFLSACEGPQWVLTSKTDSRPLTARKLTLLHHLVFDGNWTLMTGAFGCTMSELIRILTSHLPIPQVAIDHLSSVGINTNWLFDDEATNCKQMFQPSAKGRELAHHAFKRAGRLAPTPPN